MPPSNWPNYAFSIVYTIPTGMATLPGSAGGGSGGGSYAFASFDGQIKITGNKMTNGGGSQFQVRGANVMGLEYTAQDGFSIQDPFGGQSPKLTGANSMATWKMNTVRLPLNPASWKGQDIIQGSPVNGGQFGTGMMRYGGDNQLFMCDPGNNYQTTVINQVNALVAAGMYVILEEHWDNPANIVPDSNQGPMPSMDHGPDFWKSLTKVFGYPNGSNGANNKAILFEMFNEPYPDMSNGTRFGSTWTATGGTTTTIVDTSRSWATNMWAGNTVKNVTSGQTATVLSNTATTLTLSSAITATNSGDSYQITNPTAWQALGHGASISAITLGNPTWLMIDQPWQLSAPPVGGTIHPGDTWTQGANTFTVYGYDPIKRIAYTKTSSGAPVTGTITKSSGKAAMTCITPAATYVSSGTASAVLDKNYSNYWQPSALPATATFDIGALVTAGMKNCLVTWYNDSTYNYNELIHVSTPTYNLVGTYTVQTNTAASGTQPTTGWYTVYTTTGNYFNGLQHVLAVASSGGQVNWIRVSFTAMSPADAASVPSIKMNLFDATYGCSDGWLFGGDSITANAMGHVPTGSADSFDNMAHTFGGNYAGTNAYPWSVKAGMAGWKAGDLLTIPSGGTISYWEAWLQMFPGRYVGISMGANDAGAGSIATPAATYTANMLQLANLAAKYGKVVIIPTITYSPDSTRNPNVITQNNAMTAAIAANPWIIRGPDLYTIFSTSATSGTASAAGTTTTLTDSTKSWVPGGYVGMVIHNTTKGVSATITSNTATTMTFTGGMTAASSGDAYYVDGSVLINATDNLHPIAQGNAVLRTHWAYFAANISQTNTATISNIQTGNQWAGMQDQINAVRSTGATNVCLVSGISYSNDLSGMLANIPTDPLGQMGVAWHPYPPVGNVIGATIVNGGTGWTSADIGKTITTPLGMGQGGSYDGITTQSVFTIMSVSGGAVTGLGLSSGGIACKDGFYTQPVPMLSTTGAGTGVTFTLTFGSYTGSSYSYVQQPLVATINATYPVVITESGDWSNTGMTTSLFETELTQWADTNAIGLTFWAWNAYGGTWRMVQGTSAAPTGVAPGFGTVAYNWLSNHA